MLLNMTSFKPRSACFRIGSKLEHFFWASQDQSLDKMRFPSVMRSSSSVSAWSTLSTAVILFFAAGNVMFMSLCLSVLPLVGSSESSLSSALSPVTVPSYPIPAPFSSSDAANHFSYVCSSVSSNSAPLFLLLRPHPRSQSHKCGYSSVRCSTSAIVLSESHKFANCRRRIRY